MKILNNLNKTDAEKAQMYLDNHSKIKKTWADISKEMEVPQATITRLKGHPERLKVASWELVHKLAEAQDKHQIEQIVGRNYKIVSKAIEKIIDDRVQGTDKLAEALRDILKSDPMIIAYLAEILEKEEDNDEKSSEESS